MRIRLHQNANYQLMRIVRCGTGNEKHRNATRSRFLGQVDPGTFAGQAHIAQDKIDLLAVQGFDGIAESIEGRHDLISLVADQIFIVECSQRLVLNNEDSIDDPLALPEQHSDSV